MESQNLTYYPGIFARILLFIIIPWKILFCREFAAKVNIIYSGGDLPVEKDSSIPVEGEEQKKALLSDQKNTPQKESPPSSEPDASGILFILSVLQREGRFLDFLQENLESADDADIGAAARVIHEGCRNAISEYVEIKALLAGEEGDSVSVEAGFNPEEMRLTGNITGSPPFRGKLAHPGWKAENIKLPSISDRKNPLIIAPAEIEIG